MTTDRRTVIADAIIETLAKEGSRGLTHRAVDDTAGLPRGSTSYYLRTRASLLEAAVDRLAENDMVALQPRDGETLAELLARLVDVLSTTDRGRTLARYELTLEAVRRPEIRAALDAGSQRVHADIAELLVQEGVTDADDVAGDVMALLDGLLLRRLRVPAATYDERAEVQRAIERLL